MANFNPERIPNAIPILVGENGKELRLCHEGLERIFLHPGLKGKRLCIISIAGASRKGKSFLLNMFLRYLRNRGWENVDNWLGDVNATLDEGFTWNGGIAGCTRGIVMWDEVFFINNGHEEIAVLLMDTQGLFDRKMDRATDTIVFALSTILSSVQIFNLSHQIQDNDLEILQLFADYGKVAQKSDFGDGMKPFQTLTFLIRDWPNAREYQYGMDGGNQYLQRVLDEESRNEESRAIKKHLKEYFQSMNCCLLPYPGEKVAEARVDEGHSYTLRLSDINEKFLREAAQFVAEILKPGNLVMKCVDGFPVQAETVLEHLKNCADTFMKGELPSRNSMLENIALARNLEALRFCENFYSVTLSEVIGDNIFEDEILQDIHRETSNGAFARYRDMTRLGREESRKSHRKYLEQSIEREFNTAKLVQTTRKNNAQLKLSQLVECLADSYDSALREVLQGNEYIEEHKLEESHDSTLSSILSIYDADDSVGQSYSRDYRSRLEEKIARTYQTCRANNKQKKEIAEERDATKRKILLERIEMVYSFRQAVLQSMKEFVDEKVLNNTCQTKRVHWLEVFGVNARIVGGSISTTEIENETKKLDESLQEEIKILKEINEEKKDTLLLHLDSERSTALIQYRMLFQEILRKGYMKKVDLVKQHYEVASQVMAMLEKTFGSSQSKLVREHLNGTKRSLEAEYPEVEKWNDSNRSFMSSVVKFVKVHLPKLLAIAAIILAATGQ